MPGSFLAPAECTGVDLAWGVSAAQAVTLQDASFVSLPGGKVEVKLEFDAAPPAPKSYMIESPPRLVMDLWGAQNGMDNKTLSVKSGDVDSVNVAEANDRLRIVMNLTDSVGYKPALKTTACMSNWAVSSAARRWLAPPRPPPLPGRAPSHPPVLRRMMAPVCVASTSSASKAIAAE